MNYLEVKYSNFLIGEVMIDYDDRDVELEDFKAYLGDFITMFEESYYPDYFELESPAGYEDHYKYLGGSMENIGKGNEYFKSAIDSDDEEEMLENLDGALLELEQSSEWMDKVQNN